MFRTKPVLLLFLLLQVFTCSLPGEAADLSLETILPPSTYRNYQNSDYPEKLKIIRNAIQNTCTRLRVHVAREEEKEFLLRLKELEYMTDEAQAISEAVTSPKLQRHKEVKRLEIFLRQQLDFLDDLKLDVPLEKRKSFHSAIDSMDRLRKMLFTRLFEGASDFENEIGSNSLRFNDTLVAASVSPPPAPVQGLHDIDRFTEKEFRKIQVSREVGTRIETLVEIASSRLDEIERRWKEEEWLGEEPNPLEFYTYQDLLHAFNRALEASMHTIDEHYERRLSRLSEIEDALEELNESCQVFEPRLESLETLIKEEESLDLAMKLKQAQEFNTKALEGTEAGMKSLENRKD